MINIGDKVRKKFNVFITGIVTDIHIFDGEKLYIVKIGDELVKCRESEIEVIREEPKLKPDEITITRDEFIRKFFEALKPNRYNSEHSETNIGIMLSGIVILHELETILFGEK